MMDEIQKEIVNIEKSIVKSFNERNIKATMKYFSKDFVGFSSTKHDRVPNLTQLKKTFLHYLDEGDEVIYAIQKLKVKIYGEAALSTFYWTVELKKGRRKPKLIHGRGSHVYLMLDDGWSIVHEHYSKAH
jgi:ketosteroid isomerase-like protein